MKQQRAEASKKTVAGDSAAASPPEASATESPSKSATEDAEILALTILMNQINGISSSTTLEQLRTYRTQVERQTVLVNQQLEEIENKRNEILREIGNLIHSDVPISNDEEENDVVRTSGDVELGTKVEDVFQSHVDLIMSIEGMDAERGAEVSGSRGYYLKGAAWFLKEALINYAVRFLVDRDFEVVEPP